MRWTNFSPFSVIFFGFFKKIVDIGAFFVYNITKRLRPEGVAAEVSFQRRGGRCESPSHLA